MRKGNLETHAWIYQSKYYTMIPSFWKKMTIGNLFIAITISKYSLCIVF